jgi:spoIIIJ-associated protein
VNDAKNDVCEFVGDGRDEAIGKACQHFGVDDESALEISGFEAGAVYGLATRTVIVAVPKGRARSERSRSDSGRGDSGRSEEEGRGDSGRGSGRDSNRGRDRDRGRDRNRGDRDRGRESSASSREEREPSRGPKEEREPSRGSREEREPSRGPKEEREPREPRGDRERAPKAESSETAPATGPSVGSVSGELGEIGQFLLGTIERMGLGAFEISESKEGEMIVLQVKGSAAQTLSSGQGRTVDALQLLVNQVSARVSPERQRVVIDVEGDADAREEFLGKLAERVAKRALQTGRPVALDPMNGRDRRLIHVALRDREDVATMSEGEGRYRQVVVVPESSDEFEDARTQSERAGSDS